MDKDTQIDLVEKYLKQQLSAEERQAFEALSGDRDFQAELERRRLAHKLLDYSIAKNLRDELQELEATDKLIPMRARTKKLRFIWSAAAAILLLIGVFFMLNTPSEPAALALEYYQLPDQTIRGSSLETVSPDNWSNGMLAFEKGDYALAVTTFGAIARTDENYLPARYFQAHAYYQLEQYDQAEAGFADVLGGNDLRYSEEAAWYALLSCLAQGSDCSQRLDVLISNADHIFYQEALEISRRLQ